ncbi:MAG: fructose-6-phosphate aldolase [Deltaproteobacteria bacterium]|nr:fructose-6-phosphate aldolase [Deltaproteobacteria bacterium]MBW1921199.1 fructose-6-phosphate aldolase [Deltaproteobacteria bacterium]MBW1933481.1 fructose-6-phosphate aldolase [Deltaproteobacteria bacterium]RLB30808.1 MAG: fructose-6-phosphate aldolase [Deltaproteobacteria bacterium]
MKFFLDTANVEQIRKASELGLLDGVTTNPTLISRESREFKGLIEEICGIVSGPVNTEVVSRDAEGMISEAKELVKIAGNIVVKIPLIREGLKAVKVLSAEGIKTNVTLCFSPVQALMAAKAGAAYISPFVGRLDDISHRGMELVEQIIAIYENYGYDTEVIVASIRNPLHVLDAALMGADIATMPYGVMEHLINHPLTGIGLEKFLADWKKVG